MTRATKNAHDWHCEDHDTFGWRGESCSQCPTAPPEIESMRQQLSEAQIDIDLDRDFVDTVVEEITPEECEASECSSHSDNRLVYFTAGDGTIQIHRRHSGDRLELCPAEARELYLWIANSGIWKV